MSRHILVVTSARSDFGLLRPLIDALRVDPAFSVTIAATGMHFSARHGHTIDEIMNAGYGDITIQLPAPQADDSAAAAGSAIGAAVGAFAAHFSTQPPDIVVVLGDRYDMMPAPLAALSFGIPVAHISGGEITEGVIDDNVRHAVTKLSHLHFPALPVYGERLQRMGEEPWRIVISGEPGLDRLVAMRFPAKTEVFVPLGLDPSQPLTIFTFHPESLEAAAAGAAISQVLAAAEGVPGQMLLTYPNSDPGSDAIIAAIEAFAQARAGTQCVKSLGRETYLNVLRHADAMVGNSSSGIVEAASFQLPVVDIGDRQKGRLSPANVLKAPVDAEAIHAAWSRALSAEFRASLAGLVNPYGDGHACARIVDMLKSVKLGPSLLTKVFYDGPPS